MKTIHLLSDEQLVVQWLSQYGPLPIELVRTWLSYKPQNIQDKILKNLLIHGFIYQVAENILTIDPTTVIPNEDIVRAGWVLSRLDGIDPHAHGSIPCSDTFSFSSIRCGYYGDPSRQRTPCLSVGIQRTA